MNFKKHRIRNQIRKYQQAEKNTAPAIDQSLAETAGGSRRRNQGHYINLVTILAGLILIFALFWITMSIIKSLDFSSLVFSFGKDLKKDSHKLTNFLLVGIGGGEHDGSNLTDTIIVASLSEKDHSVKMLSIPRDLYIDDKLTGGQKINKIYDSYYNKYQSSPQAMEKLGELITSFTGLPIDYTVKIDFNGFIKIVDALGGVDVNVEKSIYDPYYPLGETIKYETFSLSAGPQHLDGETALKYARSRKTTSDFDRAKRQQQLLSAIKDKALSLNILTDAGKIQSLYNSVADSLETNLSVAEIIELAKISQDIGKDNIESRVFTDDFTSCGGYLYSPVRDYFGGAAVLLPAGNGFDEIKRFAENYFYGAGLANTEIQVLNGTKIPGLALDYLNRLSRDCLNVVYYGNATDRELKQSAIYYQPLTDAQGQKQIPPEVDIIRQNIDAPAVEGIPPEYLQDPKRINTGVVLELGADYKTLTTPDPFNKLLYTTPVTPPEGEAASTAGAEQPLNTPDQAKTATGTSKTSATTATGSTAASGTSTKPAGKVVLYSTTNSNQP